MNTFGRLFRVSLFGESHGPCVGVLIDGCPPGLPLSADELAEALARRRAGAPGTTPRRERDIPRLRSGVFQGRTTGAPLLVECENEDVDSSAYEALRRTPRPGHADWVALKRYGGFADWRGGGHFSGRLTVGLVIAGAVARKLLPGVSVAARVVSVGGNPDVDAGLAEAERRGDSVGGIVECRAEGLPPGWGEPFFDSVESSLAHLLFAIPAVKAVEFGAGFAAGAMFGSDFQDPIIDRDGRVATNHAGGINGGLTNGAPLEFRVAVKPSSGGAASLSTVDLETGAPVRLAPRGRHDRCIALRAPSVVEAITWFALADFSALKR